MRLHILALALAAGLAPAQAADIGGWMEQKARNETPRDSCAETIAQATRTPAEAEGAAQRFYASGLCYLASDRIARDGVAATAWLTRAAELGHPLARRALMFMREADAAQHPAAYHCHDLSPGNRLCHGAADRP
jgi:TPR repeat protein